MSGTELTVAGVLAVFNEQFVKVVHEYLLEQSVNPADASLGLKAFAGVLSQTVCFKNDHEIVPALIEMCRLLNVSLVLDELGISSDRENLRHLAGELISVLIRAQVDHSYMDGLDLYPVEQLMHLNLAKVHRWAEAAYGICTVEELAQGVVAGLTSGEKQKLCSVSFDSIAFLGDSTMYSGHWSAIVAYPDIIREVFMQICRPLRVINAGIGGNKSNQGLERLQQDVIKQAVDVCYFSFGGNDSQFDEHRNNFVIPLHEYRRNVGMIVEQLKQSNVVPVIGVPIKKKCYHTNLQDYKSFINVVVDVASDKGVLMYDLFNCIPDSELDACISEDGIHMNTQGQLVLARSVLEHILMHFCD